MKTYADRMRCKCPRMPKTSNEDTGHSSDLGTTKNCAAACWHARRAMELNSGDYDARIQQERAYSVQMLISTFKGRAQE